MNVLRIKETDCRNCYKCVRVCPVKAIKITAGQAVVDENRCILCGQCWRACPQHAKEVVSDLPAVHNLLQGTSPVFVSLAPSLAAAWPGVRPRQVITALLRLGFAGVSQTAMGAAVLNQGYLHLLKQQGSTQPWMTTACPAFVNLVERNYPDLLDRLSPLPSPLIVHARLLKRAYPGSKVVFIGPCLAKKAEAARTEYAGLVDAVLLSSELMRWVEAEGIALAELPDSEWLSLDDSVAALYPIHGGMLQYLELTGQNCAAVDGVPQLQELLQGLRQDNLSFRLIECNACNGGCLNGPDMPDEEPLLKRRQKLYRYNEEQKRSQAEAAYPPLSEVDPQGLFGTDYRSRAVSQPEFTDLQIRQVLQRIGKYDSDEELNCGACGYATCRDKARAVLAGMAEPEMCMPYMRSQAESLANLVMQTTPNGLIVVDQQLLIREFNHTAELWWKRTSGEVKGQPLSLVMPDDDYAFVRDSGQPIVGKKVALPKLGLVTSQTILALAGGAGLLLGIITDITQVEKQAEELARVKAETVRQAQSVIDRQMRVAQEIAGLLGEATADSKVLLMRLIRLVQGEAELR